MAIRVKHDMDPATVAATVQSAVRQESAERAAATRASRSVGTRAAAPAAPRGPRRNAQNVGSFVQPGSVAPPPAGAPEGPNSIDELVVGEIVDGFNQYLAEFDKYEVDPADKAKFTSTWRAIVEDDSIDYADKVTALQAVLQRGQRMIDASPQRRDKRAEFLMSLKDNPDPWVYDPDKGELVENVFATSKADERKAALAQEKEARQREAEERRKQAQAAKEQQTQERLDLERQRNEIAKRAQELRERIVAADAEQDERKGVMQTRTAAATRVSRIMVSYQARHQAESATQARALRQLEDAEEVRENAALMAPGYRRQAEDALAAAAALEERALGGDPGAKMEYDALQETAAQAAAMAEKYQKDAQDAADRADALRAEAKVAGDRQLEILERMARAEALLAELDMVESDADVQRLMSTLSQ